MKKLLLLLFSLIFSIHSFSKEKYFCSVDLSEFGQTGVEMKIYERTGDYFTKTKSEGEKEFFYILEENESFLTLIKSTSNYPSVFITFIDKKNKTFHENYVYTLQGRVIEGLKETSTGTSGTFIRVD